ncbi:MAG: aminotransferase class V-fold PLP-dependent enzyme, partial [Treponema sp.]|nr:aminotransferase class V-fold PLP-dependent enzyme [Treponema sp.]
MKTLFNFSAGPSVLPKDVLAAAQKDLVDYQGCGMSVMEMSHRAKEFDEIIKKTEELFHKVMGIPENYKVLFLQGGATQQFAMVPMNLLAKKGKADYVLTGNFASAATRKRSCSARRFPWRPLLRKKTSRESPSRRNSSWMPVRTICTFVKTTPS